VVSAGTEQEQWSKYKGDDVRPSAASFITRDAPCKYRVYRDSIIRYRRDVITEHGDTPDENNRHAPRSGRTPDVPLLLITANNPFVTV